ncbi:MAG: phage adsorption protein NrfB [Desulfovibrio sp.]|nr:phage adsorption protein NrfB [Desulfovibrio sp.]MBI4959479.1 phage adsorption protein NrfB [Desulfovibrio sp.]
MWDFDLIAPFALLGLKLVLIALSIVFFLSGIDELFFDFVYLVRLVYRRLFILPKFEPLTEQKLLSVPEKLIAVMIPCWDESAVIRKMLTNTIRSVNYSNYYIFVGTYPNDQATQREVEIARESFDNVQRIVCPKDGPTNKADCLNWVYEGIKVFEKDNNLTFEIFVMNDSEDIVHPLYLKLFNYLIPAKDMVQLPVFPLPGVWWNLTRGHYLDEFAENHCKDMTVREVLSKSVPSAGVGSAYSRRALDTLAAESNNQLFNINSLTEDYDFGMRLGKHGFKQIFVRHAILRKVKKRGIFGRPREGIRREYVVIQEFFPGTLSTAIRQKSRWVIGIALQGWASIGWQGNFWTRYMLARDRKSLLTNQVNMLGNMLVPIIGGFWLYRALDPEGYRYPPLVDTDSPLWIMLYINMFFLLWRMLWRGLYTTRIYGPWQGLLSVPRLFWGNLINFCATMRALRMYARYLVTGKIIAWDKTAHVYPSEEEMRAYRRRLGDLLLDKRYITVHQLDEALEQQKKTGRALGDVLLSLGLIKEDDLVQTLGTQFRLSTSQIDPYAVPLNVLGLIPKEIAQRNDIFPLGLDTAGALRVAVLSPLGSADRSRLEEALGRPLEMVLTSKSNMAFALQRGYERLQVEDVPASCHLGERLLQESVITSEQLDSALREQRGSYSRLGDILVMEGLLPFKRLQQAISDFFQSGSPTGRFGNFLVENSYITQSQLDHALRIQTAKVRLLGDILEGMGVKNASIKDALAKKCEQV